MSTTTINSMDPVFEHLFRDVLGYHNPKKIIDHLLKIEILDIYDFLCTDDYKFGRGDEHLMNRFKGYLREELEIADLDEYSADEDFWFGISKEAFKTYRRESLKTKFSPVKKSVTSYNNIVTESKESNLGVPTTRTTTKSSTESPAVVPSVHSSVQPSTVPSVHSSVKPSTYPMVHSSTKLLETGFRTSSSSTNAFNAAPNNSSIFNASNTTTIGGTEFGSASTPASTSLSTPSGSTSLFDNTSTTGSSTNGFNQSNPSTTVFDVFEATTSPTLGASTGMFGTVQSPQQSGTKTVLSTTIRSDDDSCEVIVAVIQSTEDHVALLKTVFDFQATNALLDRTDSSMVYDTIHGPYAKAVFQEELGQPDSTCANDIPKDDFAGGHADPTLTYAKELIHTMGIDKAGLKIMVYDPGGSRHTIFLDEKKCIQFYRLLIRSTQWTITLGRFDVMYAVVTSCSILSSTLKKRHNTLAYHKLRECVAAGIIQIFHVSEKENVADLLTKPVDGSTFKRHRNRLLIAPVM